jgi:Zn-dependent peptidase ImmA (M78 family)
VELQTGTELESDCLCAARELSRLFARSTPPFCASWLAERFGVSEVRERPLDRDARLIRESGRLFIEVNSLFPNTRRRLSIAHEIGHLIVDRCSPMGQSHWGHENPIIESLCDRLAEHLLAPDWAVRVHFQNEPELSAWQHPIRCSSVLTGAAKFGISVDAMASRVFGEMALAPNVEAVIWRFTENANSSDSERQLRVASAWNMKRGAISSNKIASTESVVKKAFERNGVFSGVEELPLGTRRSAHEVEAQGFGPLPSEGGDAHARAVLSLLSFQS